MEGVGATKQALILSRTSCPSISERIRKTELLFIICLRDVVITSGNTDYYVKNRCLYLVNSLLLIIRQILEEYVFDCIDVSLIVFLLERYLESLTYLKREKF